MGWGRWTGSRAAWTSRRWCGRRIACCRPAASAISPSDIIIREGRGGRVWDVTGNEYVDFLLGSGPMLVGHAHPEVTEAVQAQVAAGHHLLRQQPLRHRAGRGDRRGGALRRAGALRQHRAPRPTSTRCASPAPSRGRDKILKFEGGYHGMSDYALMSLAPKRAGNFPPPIPDSAGIPKSAARRDAGRPVQRPRRRREPDRASTTTSWPASSSSRSSGSSRRRRASCRAAQDHRGERHPADLRRGRDRLPLRLWRRAGILRRRRPTSARSARSSAAASRWRRSPGGPTSWRISTRARSARTAS